MRRFLWVLIILPMAAAAEAQTAATVPDVPRWDVNVNAGIFGHRPAQGGQSYDNWYSEGRYAASVGYYWTQHLKTELEFARSPEGDRHVQELARVPGTSAFHPVHGQSFHRLQQTALRMVWQFGDNAWVHPYVNGGVVLDADRQRRHLPVTYTYPGDPRTVPPILVRPGMDTAPDTVYRTGVSIGGGSKFYVAPQAYLNTGALWTYARPAKTITFYTGIGWEF